ncbi:Guanine deaminase [Bacteroidales bacterium Barb6]|nr:Guanine deaminase [Bacteroidales bacterium Barb6]
MTHEDYMAIAVHEGVEGMRSGKGGPFGAIIVAGGEIIGKGCNMVTSLNDPTAHAEIIAIRNACQAVKRFHLPDAVLYTSCEPCPMCLSAMYWAKIKEFFYCTDRFDAARIDFADQFIYDEIVLPLNDRASKARQIHLPAAMALFEEWAASQTKISY